MLFSNARRLEISLPTKDENGHVYNIASLVQHLCKDIMKDKRKELFMLDGTVYVSLGT